MPGTKSLRLHPPRRESLFPATPPRTPSTRGTHPGSHPSKGAGTHPDDRFRQSPAAAGTGVPDAKLNDAPFFFSTRPSDLPLLIFPFFPPAWESPSLNSSQ